jgi:hypothetical protein
MSLKKIQIVFLVSKLFLNYFYVAFKQWLQEIKCFYAYFSLIRLIPNFYDTYIMYSQYHFIKNYYYYYYYLFIFYNPKFKKLTSDYDYFWYMLI